MTSDNPVPAYGYLAALFIQMSRWKAVKGTSEYNQHAYDQLAGFLNELNEYGRYDFSRESLRDSLAAAHILSRDGDLNSDRLDRFMDSRGIPTPNFGDMDVDEFWQEIAEGDYF